MPVPTAISELSTTPGSNSPVGADAPSVLDDHLRTVYAFIRQLSDEKLAGADGSVTTAKIAADAVTFAKLQNIATARFLGRTTAGTGDVEELTATALFTAIKQAASETDTGVVELSTDAEGQAFTANKVIDGAKLNTAFKGSNQSLAASGYQRFPGGLIVQWGLSGTLNPGGSTAVVTLPLTFPTAILGAWGSMRGPADSGVTEAAVSVVLTSTSQITITKGSNAAGAGTARSVQWFAIGN